MPPPPQLVLFGALLVASRAHETYRVQHEPTLPDGWRTLPQGTVDDSAPITIAFAIQRRSASRLREILDVVSDPGSESYGGYLTFEQALTLAAPASEDVRVVESWLQTEGVAFKTAGVGLIEATIPISGAAKLLRADFRRISRGEGFSALRAGDVTVPADVAEVLAGIHGLYGLPLPRGPKLGSDAPVKVTPEILRTTYRVEGEATEHSRQAVVSLLDQTMNTGDLEAFFAAYVPDAPAIEAQVSKFVGDAALGKGMGEASLDIEYMKGVAPAAPTELWYFAGDDFCGLLKKWTAALVSAEDPPLVHSVSYGWQGDLAQAGCDDAIIQDIEVDLTAVAARGLTIIFSSGDAGSGWEAPSCTDSNLRLRDTAVTGAVARSFHAWSVPQCCGTANSGGYRAWTFDEHTCSLYHSANGTSSKAGATAGGDLVVPRQQRLRPSWPASSPVVTAVGATRFEAGAGSEEMAATSFGSGGGYSTLFEAPRYQQSAAEQYLVKMAAQSKLPPASSFPANGRATPDVALLGEGFQVIVNGELQSADGTSASAPSFAAMVSMLNAARSEAGLPPMGFLNPFLYQNADVFTDITKGNNLVGGWREPLEYGWHCAEGWDPVTGLGTPDYQKLREAALNAGNLQEEKLSQAQRLGRLRRHRGTKPTLQESPPTVEEQQVEEVDVGSFVQEPLVSMHVEM